MVTFRGVRHTVGGALRLFLLIKSRWLGLALVVAATIACLTVGGPVARAAGPPAGTSLVVQPLAPLDLGSTADVRARLTTATGMAIAHETVGFAVDGVRRFRVSTDQNGDVSFTVSGDLEAGTHTLTVIFEGTDTLAASFARLNLVIVPATIEIQTVPAWAGIEFALDGHPFASDSDGIARYTVARVGIYRLELVSDSISAPNTRLTFSRWGDQVFVPYRQVSVPSRNRFRIGFNVSYLTNLTFVDAANQPVAPGRIASITLRSPHRQVYTFDHVQPEWLPATTVIQDANGLKTTAIAYWVEEVTVDGVPVVDRGQQHFKLAAPSAPRISLNLYSLHVRGHDALYRFPLGTGAYLQHPDGYIEYQPFDSSGVATFTALPIATYRIGVAGGPGLARSQVFDLIPGRVVRPVVVSYLDLATIATVGGLLALIVLVSVPGRLRRRTLRLHPKPVDFVRPARQRPYAVQLGYLSLAGMLAIGFILTRQHAPGIGDPTKGAPAATVLVSQRGSATAEAGSIGIRSQPAQPEPTASVAVPSVVSPIFASVWRSSGGSKTFGDARGGSFEEVDPASGQQRTVQYFDRARLESHPEFEGTPYQVQLGRLGEEEAMLRGLVDTEPFRKLAKSTVLSTPDCEYFAATGHQLCGRFRDYWHTHGLKLGDSNAISFRESLALLGYPISEEFTDPNSGLTVQYFERARLEYHPDRAGTPDEVIAGNLNVGSP